MSTRKEINSNIQSIDARITALLAEQSEKEGAIPQLKSLKTAAANLVSSREQQYIKARQKAEGGYCAANYSLKSKRRDCQSKANIDRDNALRNLQAAKNDLSDKSSKLATYEARVLLIPNEIDELKQTKTTYLNNLASMDSQDETLTDQGLTREAIETEALGRADRERYLGEAQASTLKTASEQQLEAEETRNRMFLIFGIAIGVVLLVAGVVVLKKRIKKKKKK